MTREQILGLLTNAIGYELARTDSGAVEVVVEGAEGVKALQVSPEDVARARGIATRVFDDLVTAEVLVVVP